MYEANNQNTTARQKLSDWLLARSRRLRDEAHKLERLADFAQQLDPRSEAQVWEIVDEVAPHTGPAGRY